MANTPEDNRYAKSHEYVHVEGDVGTIGITDYAQKELGDVVFVELPQVGSQLDATDELGSIESVKAVSELFAPVTGEVIEVNEALADKPELVNTDPYGDGWMVRVRLSSPDEADELLMTAEEYEEYVEKESAK
ncbi:MAG TPA: glycine cleavage system protein GcvH [Thermoanaerobaculia bacterium]|nr:glycine cleavage system protein GcvH [Thermoanaerobaculia bacterium]